MDKKILVIEDDPDISGLIGAELERNGYVVDRAYSGTEALLLLERSSYDLIISDLMLPGVGGEEIVKRYGAAVPIIIVSAKVSIDDKVNNLLNGAADYITKPFSSEELLARVQVQLRKKQQACATGCDDVYIDDELNTAFACGRPLRLTKTEFSILKLLIANPNRIFSKSQLIEHASRSGEIFESSLNVHVSNLRKKLNELCGKNYIEAIWGIGYRFLPDKKS